MVRQFRLGRFGRVGISPSGGQSLPFLTGKAPSKPTCPAKSNFALSEHIEQFCLKGVLRLYRSNYPEVDMP